MAEIENSTAGGPPVVADGAGTTSPRTVTPARAGTLRVGDPLASSDDELNTDVSAENTARQS
ncbi:hypothetical protein [Variovorax atrisoli]|uniref:hypothetical protein n=1 Tax=Variovorax atrisoli TaxID=3394203 RepID=UPI0016118508|nr:hypothetical protein [Variovorax sp. BK613]MBB3637157.1 hypothetical protein [Variovorax sp. BK613]